jgi:hypothetical protein
VALEEVKWSKDRRRAFEQWMTNEIAQTEGDRHRLERKWKDLILRLRARVIGSGTSDVPFVGASDLEYPLSAIHFEPVYADLMQTLHVPKNFWSITPIRADRVDSAKPFQEFLGIVEREELGMRQVNERALIDLVALGTVVFKDYILHDRKVVRDYDETGAVVKKTKLNFRPQVRHIPLQDFWIPAYAWRINPDEPGGSPWVSHYFELTKSQFRQRAKAEAPFLPDYEPKAVERVLLADTDEPETVKDTIRREDEFVPWQDRTIKLHEVWARFDTDGDGIDEDVTVIWHQPSGTILRATYNPFMHGERPFEAVSYIPGFGFYGAGVVEADEWAQLAMTRLLNAAIDNTVIANSRMYSAPLGSNISPDEPIHSGKIWLLGPGEKIDTIEMGEVYPSLFNLMDRFMQWSESRTGVSELRQGNISNLPGRTPASTVMNVLSEGNKKFDMVLTALREAYARIGRRVMKNLIQISKTDPRYKGLALQTLGEVDGLKVVEILSGPVNDVEEIYGVSVTATSSQVNKEVEKQSFTGLAQLAAQMYPQLVQYSQAIAQIKGDPTMLGATIEAAYTGTTELFTRLLETFDIQNPDEYVPALAQQAQAAQLGAGGMPGQPGLGGVQPGAAPGAMPGMAPTGTPAFAPAAQGGDVLSQVLGL